MNSGHSAHCGACKERLRELLNGIYGGCQRNHSFPWPAGPEHYDTSALGSWLRQIHTALGSFRGHRDFVRSAQLPPCDFYISDPPFILEFDESQHFSRARLITLSHYSDALQVGFSVVKWKELCRKLDSRDDTPIDRDERRAWYDTLRDLLPPFHGLGPTVRLYAGERPWCSLDPRSRADRNWLLALLSNRAARSGPRIV